MSQRHSWGSKNSFAAVPMNWVTLVSSFCESALREAASGRGKWALSSLDRGGACLEVHQSGFRTLWRVHRSWSLAIPAAFRTPVSHEIVSSVAIFSLASWLRDVPSLSLLTPFSFHCLLHPAEARQLRRCDVDNGSLSTRYENVYGIVNISEPRRRAESPQHVLLERPGICQLINTMQSPVPHHRLDTTIWKFTAAQHFACFKRQLRSLGVSHQRSTLRGLRSGGATDHWLQHRNLPQLRRRGRWTSARTLGRYVQEGTSLHPNWLSKECADRVRALAELAPRFFAEQDCRKSPTTTPCSYHVETERVEEFTPFCAAASSSRALPTPSCFSERHLYHFVTWHKNMDKADDADDTSPVTLG